MVPITGIDFRTGHKEFFFHYFQYFKSHKVQKKIKTLQQNHTVLGKVALPGPKKGT
jgi:hypothetical protein